MKIRKQRKFGLLRPALFGAAALCGAISSAPSQAVSENDGPLVFTLNGPVRGAETAAGIKEFLGIPYAAPPVGDLRWMPPVEHARWNAPLEATQFGNHCPQLASPFGVASTTEDCLFLNVFTPPPDSGHGIGGLNVNRPVMVWIHGGALVTGESDDYDPTAMVKDGVIVVTINYRLGALGFLAHPDFEAESTDPDRNNSFGHFAGDYGLMDQQFAMQWVRQNIIAFGGDPDNVTIFGESAGGLSVFSALVSPPAGGLFDKAIIESGAYALTTQPLATAEASGTAFATAAGCNSQTAACLRALPVTTVLAHEAPAGYTPNIDGSFFPLSIDTALTTGQFNRVPTIQGTNHDEYRLFTALDFDLVGGPIADTPTAYQAAIASLVGPVAAPLVADQYPLASFPSADVAFATLGTDEVFACPALDADQSLTKFVRLFTYEFNDENAPEDFLPPVSFPYGAAHASELQYLFNTAVTIPRAPLTPGQLQLSSTMQRFWTDFAKSGTPNIFGSPGWQPFSTAGGNFESLLPPTPSQETNFATFHHCAFWTALLSPPG